VKAGAAHLKRRVRKLGGFKKPWSHLWVLVDDGEGGVTTWEGQPFPSVDAARAALGIPDDAHVVVVTFVEPNREGDS